jgi:chromosome segregation and condensation protein ScpB
MIPDEMIAKICAALFLLGDNVSIAKLEEIVTSKSNKESDTVDKVLQLNLNEDSIDRINVELGKFGLQIILSNDQIQMTTVPLVSDIVKAIKLDEVSGDLTLNHSIF